MKGIEFCANEGNRTPVTNMQLGTIMFLLSQHEWSHAEVVERESPEYVELYLDPIPPKQEHIRIWINTEGVSILKEQCIPTDDDYPWEQVEL